MRTRIRTAGKRSRRRLALDGQVGGQRGSLLAARSAATLATASRAPHLAVLLATLLTATLLASALLALAAWPAAATSGGTSSPSPQVPGGEAVLRKGEAIAPADAPRRVKRAIEFANRIRNKPYRYGGGHSSWRIDRGYDCSGAVSYALRGARMLKRPVPSGELTRWGEKGKGDWITVYAHGGHTYAVIAGLRWDTSGGKGPRWHRDTRSARGYKVRHFRGF